MERAPPFLDAYVEELKNAGEYEFEEKLGPLWYDKPGDCVMFLSVNEGVVADRIDECLTLYRSAVDNRVIGFQLKGIRGLLQEFDYDLASIQAEVEKDEVRAVTLGMMVLKSYEKMPPTRRRIEGYAEAISQFHDVAPEPARAK